VVADDQRADVGRTVVIARAMTATVGTGTTDHSHERVAARAPARPAAPGAGSAPDQLGVLLLFEQREHSGGIAVGRAGEIARAHPIAAGEQRDQLTRRHHLVAGLGRRSTAAARLGGGRGLACGCGGGRGRCLADLHLDQGGARGSDRPVRYQARPDADRSWPLIGREAMRRSAKQQQATADLPRS
jgi:hypothetical protein